MNKVRQLSFRTHYYKRIYTNLLLGFLLLPLTVEVVLAQDPDTLRIMPLGDSITYGWGSSVDGGYRDDMYYELVSHDIPFDFVGTLSTGEGFDADHEGHGGWSSGILDDSVDVYYDLGDPDIIMLHIGTNDISGDHPIQDIVDNIESILDKAYNHNPLMEMLVAGIVPRRDNKDSLTTELNNEIYNLVLYKQQWQSYDIKYVDHNTAFKDSSGWELLMYDTRHPNDAGYALMAQVWLDSLGLIPVIDTIAPSPVTDLSAVEIGPATVKLEWTAPGDDSLLGIASVYDIRYDTLAIINGNFSSAISAGCDLVPSPAGSTETFVVTGLTPGKQYNFAMKTYDEVPNESPLSNVPEVTTIEDPTVFVDDFNREDIGNKWIVDDEMIIDESELAYIYNSEKLPWSEKALYGYAWNAGSVMLRYGKDNTQVENGSVGILFMVNTLNLNNVSGYMIRYFYSEYHLYQYINSSLQEIGLPVQEPNPPVSGDLLRVEQYRVENENRFDIYHNEVLIGTLGDPDGLYNPPISYVGVVFENEVASRMPEIDNFTISGATGNHAPTVFSLAQPIDGDTISGDVIDFIWHTSVDDDPHAEVSYEFYLDVDSLFPEAAYAVDLIDTVFSFTEPLTIGTTYYWKVVAYDEFEDRTRSQELYSAYFGHETGIDQDQPLGSGLPRIAALRQNYPNPFNPSTVIRYEVPLSGNGEGQEEVPVSLRIYDSRGRLILVLKNGTDKPGRYGIVWDGRDERGSRVASGIYVYSIVIGDKRLTRKMVLLK